LFVVNALIASTVSNFARTRKVGKEVQTMVYSYVQGRFETTLFGVSRRFRLANIAIANGRVAIVLPADDISSQSIT
jgi:hypothetical protein